MHYLALASDYDGTLAHDGHVKHRVVEVLKRFKETGRKLILVTGRELPELKKVFSDIGLCDCVVAENGALLYWPADGREDVLGEPPPDKFIVEMRHRDVHPFSQGRVIFATWRPHETAVLEVIQQLGLGYQIIFNKGAVMVLPSTINKATGLSKALKKMTIDPHQVVGVGDAENDHAFLEMCGVSVAVSNALPVLKERVDLVTTADHGFGVVELIDRIMSDDLQSLGPRAPRKETTTRTIQS
jgi:hydroxymethylpyrimidine pyrophosphatase-like HAD family hydrolase